MTEDEAFTKWCPFVRHAYATDKHQTNPPAVAANRMADTAMQYAGCNCIGSACAAWRWSDEHVLVDAKTHEARPVKPPFSYDGSTHYSDTQKSSTEGYCGLAGRL